MKNLTLERYTRNDVSNLVKRLKNAKKEKIDLIKNHMSVAFCNCFLYDLKKLKEKKTKKKTKENKKYQKDILIKCLKQLNNCFTINKNVKIKAYSHEECCVCDGSGCSNCDYTGISYTNVDYNLRDKMYSDKELILKQCINLITTYRLPIKYGKNDNIIYFEYLGSQVSFHDFKDKIRNCKPFKGEWTGIINKKIPFKINN